MRRGPARPVPGWLVPRRPVRGWRPARALRPARQAPARLPAARRPAGRRRGSVWFSWNGFLSVRSSVTTLLYGKTPVGFVNLRHGGGKEKQPEWQHKDAATSTACGDLQFV
ncbi:MAG: hypothetical protein DBX91_05790 [Subdoligranulum variabile]|nr:MAG: hypothetical protein DBX91_05790 [Subdoligranulum variabile]